jgi:hypothetical protein
MALDVLGGKLLNRRLQGVHMRSIADGTFQASSKHSRGYGVLVSSVAGAWVLGCVIAGA